MTIQCPNNNTILQEITHTYKYTVTSYNFVGQYFKTFLQDYNIDLQKLLFYIVCTHLRMVVCPADIINLYYHLNYTKYTSLGATATRLTFRHLLVVIIKEGKLTIMINLNTSLNTR